MINLGGILLKKHFLLSLLFIISASFLFSEPALAFRHGYDPETDFIYALARNELPIYDSEYSYNVTGTVPKYTGITVIGTSGSWYEIQYKTKKKGTRYGWVTKEEFNANCLVYDGTEKAPFADGTYLTDFRGGTAPSGGAVPTKTAEILTTPLTLYFTYVGDSCYTIASKDKDSYLLADAGDGANQEFWGSKEKAGLFRIIRQGDCYTICDAKTNRYLAKNETGILTFTGDADSLWRLTRTKKAVKKKFLHLFVQFDPTWAKHHYGNETKKNTEDNNFATSACGVFAMMNAIYTLTGHYADPYELADYASDKHYRIEDCGTDSAFFKAAAKKFGSKYGFSYDGSGETTKELKRKLKAGDTAIAYLPGHYAAVVDYDSKKNKFLLMDSHYLAKRGTSSFGDWVSAKNLEEGALVSQMFFYFRAD